MMRLVLDTNVVVSGLLWDGSPQRLLRTVDTHEVLLFTSVPLLDELAVTLSRSKFDAKRAASLLTLNELIGFYSDLASVILPAPTPRLAPDPDDDGVIGTALSAQADLIVTGDRTLLSVSTFEGGRIVSVQEALKLCGVER